MGIKIDPGIRFTEAPENNSLKNDPHPNRIPLLMILAVLLFATGMILKYIFSVNTLLNAGIFSIAYLLSGWKVLKNAFLNGTIGKCF